MAIYYINPTHTFDGDGTTTGEAASDGATGAHNTWASTGEIGTLSANNTYLGKGGETWSAHGNATITVTGGNIVMGTYPTDMSLGRHVMDFSSGFTLQDCIRPNGDGQTIENLHLIGPGTVVNHHMIYFNTLATTDFTLSNCYIDGNVTTQGSVALETNHYLAPPFSIVNNEVVNCNTGLRVQLTGTSYPANTEISYISGNYVHSTVYNSSVYEDAGDFSF